MVDEISIAGDACQSINQNRLGGNGNAMTAGRGGNRKDAAMSNVESGIRTKSPPPPPPKEKILTLVQVHWFVQTHINEAHLLVQPRIVDNSYNHRYLFSWWKSFLCICR